MNLSNAASLWYGDKSAYTATGPLSRLCTWYVMSSHSSSPAGGTAGVCPVNVHTYKVEVVQVLLDVKSWFDRFSLLFYITQLESLSVDDFYQLLVHPFSISAKQPLGL